VSRIDAPAPEMTRFQALDTDFINSVLDRKHAQILTDDHAPLNYLMGFDSVIE